MQEISFWLLVALKEQYMFNSVSLLKQPNKKNNRVIMKK